QVGLDILRDKAIIQPVDVLTVLIKHNIGDQHIADTAIKRGSFAQDIDTTNLRYILHDFTQHSIGSHTERIINIDDNGLTAGQFIHPRHAAARINLHVVQFGEFKHLRVNLQTMTRSYVPDAALLLFAYAIAREFFPGRCTRPLASGKVQKVLPVTGNRSLLEFAALVGEVGILAAQGVLSQLILTPQDAARHQVGETMRIAGNEVDGLILNAQRFGEQAFNRCPPFARGADIANM